MVIYSGCQITDAEFLVLHCSFGQDFLGLIHQPADVFSRNYDLGATARIKDNERLPMFVELNGYLSRSSDLTVVLITYLRIAIG